MYNKNIKIRIGSKVSLKVEFEYEMYSTYIENNNDNESSERRELKNHYQQQLKEQTEIVQTCTMSIDNK